jgi:hypothetical protein
MKLYNLNKHIRDNNIKFYKIPHEYQVNGKKMKKSVTKLVHDCFPEFDQNKVSKICVDKYFNNENSEYYQMSQDAILNKWEDNKNTACDAGTFLHECIELYYNDCDFVNNTQEYKYFKNFYNDHKHLEAYRTEWEIYYEEKSIAGSVDMVFKNQDGTFSIYDWKRSKKIEKYNNFESGLGDFDHLPNCNFWHYSLQLNIYKYILELKYNIIIHDLYLVIMHPINSNYIKIKCPNLQEEVQLLMNKL